MTAPETLTEPVRVPAHVQPYVDALGEDLALTFLLHFGGADLYIPSRPTGRSELVDVVGMAGAEALYQVRDRLQFRVPVAKPWIARVLHQRGLPKSKIARKMHVTVTSVTRYLQDAGPRSAPDPEQMSLF